MFTPKLISIWRDGYSLQDFKDDVFAGLTVAVLALPLSMAIATASGGAPETGLYTSIVGGFLISALGGSRFQIGGPAGAFIVVVSRAIDTFGFDGFLLATLLSGIMLVGIGALRLGSYIRYVPHTVVVGFSAAIALLIFASQIHDLFGLSVTHEPAEFFSKLPVLFSALPTTNFVALAIALFSIVFIVAMSAWKPHFPVLIVVVALAGLAAWAFQLPVETIGSRFGGIPGNLPQPHIPTFSLEKVVQVMPTAAIMALLGAIESLLSAAVADSMTGRRHRSNMELVAQGIANIASPLFGGLCATGTVARTATNIRAHARSPIAGMLHSVFLLVFILLAAPLANSIPLASLSAVLAIVCWNMSDRHEFVALLRSDRAEALTLLATFLLTLIYGLPEGIGIGLTLSALIFMHRMAGRVSISTHIHADPQTTANSTSNPVIPILITEINGPLFFGAVSEIGTIFARIDQRARIHIIDLAHMPLIDGSGVKLFENFLTRTLNQGSRVIFSQLTPDAKVALSGFLVREPEIILMPNLASAIELAKAELKDLADQTGMPASEEITVTKEPLHD